MRYRTAQQVTTTAAAACLPYTRRRYSKANPAFVTEPTNPNLRTVYNVHDYSDIFARLIREKRLLDILTDVLASRVCIYQCRLNLKAPFEGEDFWWHSDFESWVAEDGMQTPRAMSICLTTSY